jgi:hypothetical protein
MLMTANVTSGWDFLTDTERWRPGAERRLSSENDMALLGIFQGIDVGGGRFPGQGYSPTPPGWISLNPDRTAKPDIVGGIEDLDRILGEAFKHKIPAFRFKNFNPYFINQNLDIIERFLAPGGNLNIINIGGQKARELVETLLQRGYNVTSKTVRALDLTDIYAVR